MCLKIIRKLSSVAPKPDLKTSFSLKIKRYFVKLCNKTCGKSRFRIEGFNSNFGLRSRRLEVVGTRKNGRARRRHARGEGAPARKAPENRFPPQSNYLAAVARSVKSFDSKRPTSHKQSVPPKSVAHFIFGLNISVIKISWVI